MVLKFTLSVSLYGEGVGQQLELQDCATGKGDMLRLNSGAVGIWGALWSTWRAPHGCQTVKIAISIKLEVETNLTWKWKTSGTSSLNVITTFTI